MNKIAKSIAVSLLALSAGSAWATDGKIEFTGEILTSTCEFADGDVINVELGHYPPRSLKLSVIPARRFRLIFRWKTAQPPRGSTLMAQRTTRSNCGWKRALAAP